jgi:hypothetical protein
MILQNLGNKKYIMLGILLATFILLSSYAYAFAVSTPYWKDYPLKISPGQTEDFQLTLQNVAGAEDMTVKGQIMEGSEIAQITDSSDIYSVPIGERAQVNIRVNIPSSVEIGTNYTIKISFGSVAAGTAGAFSMGSGIDQNVPVTIVGKTSSITEIIPSISNKWIIILSVGVIILIIIIIIIMIKRKRRIS